VSDSSAVALRGRGEIAAGEVFGKWRGDDREAKPRCCPPSDPERWQIKGAKERAKGTGREKRNGSRAEIEDEQNKRERERERERKEKRMPERDGAEMREETKAQEGRGGPL